MDRYYILHIFFVNIYDSIEINLTNLLNFFGGQQSMSEASDIPVSDICLHEF